MAHLKKSPAQFEGYIIQSCTNTGVWLVEQRDSQSGQLLALYDFVNREYSMAQTGNSPISIDTMSESEKTQFLALQKNLNKALLDKGKS